MDTPNTPDAVDAIRAQWQRERPDLDTRHMAIIGRLGRCSIQLQKRLNDTFGQYGISNWEFDVLATLRRSGAPYCLAPTALFSSLMLSSGTMTRQLQLLAERGLVCRLPNPDDARSLLVQLTPQGLDLVNKVVGAHVDNMARILAPLDAAQLDALDASMSALLATLEPVTKAGR